MSWQAMPYRLLAKWIAGDKDAWIALGNAETRLLAGRLPPVTAPVYVCGLARGGTTILTEALALQPEVATHTYRDFPCLFTPYFWHRILSAADWMPFRAAPRERAHQDGMLVTPRSPEAMEEMVWMAFFDQLHDESRSAVLPAETENAPFAAFYTAHVRKLLLARKKSRYIAKANYNLTRIAYLRRRFPDARFIIPVRDPVPHVWSLYRKHRLFCQKQRLNPAALLHMDQAGHFEFGLHRRLIHTGDEAGMEAVQAAFAGGDEIRGWARYWAMLHRFILHRCASLPKVMIVRHEALCENPRETLLKIFAHGDIRFTDSSLEAAARLIKPDIAPDLPEDRRKVIEQETNEVARALHAR